MADLSGLARLVELGDLDELTRLVDRLCDSSEWDNLVELRDRCRAAVQRGKQLWPVAAHAEYRLALQAPGPWAGPMLEPGAGRFALGPLTEVAASTHTWDDLAPYSPPGPAAGMAAHERVVRGEDLTGDGRVDPHVLDLPLALESWEPAYPLAEYGPDRAEFPAPPLPATSAITLPSDVRRVEDPEPTRALLDLAAGWTAESNGRAEAVAVEGDAAAALAALGVPKDRAHMSEVSAAEAMALLAWTGASGGAHGRRRGMAAGRLGAWWVVAALARLDKEWPVHPADAGEAAASLRWFAWDAGDPVTGWSLRMAVEDPDTGRAWAVAATDAA